MSELSRYKGPRLHRAIYVSIAFAVVLWLIKLTEYVFVLDFVRYGVAPRQMHGSAGILWAPLIHSSWAHLLANTGPVIMLGSALLYGYPRSAKYLIPIVYLGVGVLVWLFARDAYHIGASGLTFGMMFFIFTIGLLRRDKQAMVLSLIVLLLYGGMLGGLHSNDPSISFESHLAGAGLGVLLAFILKNTDPAPPPKKYSWEDEDENQLSMADEEWQYGEELEKPSDRTLH